ncbi:MAG: RagB/SusD family nutrient uptake outer membrane protein [Rikenellaceae bacterium]|nr:RagB/SusD family nutrient uptake outer membrane protein [Rikenellaceae bacterium]
MRERSTTSFFSHYAVTIAEPYLNKAEAAAMLGDEATAKTTLKSLLECRMQSDYLPTLYAELDALSGAGLVQFICDERRRETPFRGHRWFDLRRYAVCPNYPVKTTITHRRLVNRDGEVFIVGYSTLGPWPEDNGWVMPFPTYALYSNDGLLVDNVRPERSIPGE